MYVQTHIGTNTYRYKHTQFNCSLQYVNELGFPKPTLFSICILLYHGFIFISLSSQLYLYKISFKHKNRYRLSVDLK